ncbi:MAG: PstS family phosphate ABC transporter substrate-binding protein [Candidatus Thorarchaeota archaeon]|jgi:ABC-type phosphate transport system substrate-binding protein
MASVRRQLVVFIVGLLIGLGFMVLLTPPSSGEGGPYTMTTAGSSTVFSLSQVWATWFQFDFPAFIVNPGTGGSGLGQSQVAQKLIDIGASSSYPNQEYLDANPMVRIIPVSADALAFVVNPAINGSTFRFDCDMAVAVFQRNVTTWEEFSSVFGVTVQQTGEIDVYVRSDASGTTATFANWLETADDNPNPQANYTWKLGHSETLSWAPGINSVYGNPGVAAGVLGDSHGIGYVGLAFVGELTPVDLYNPTTQEYVTPSLQNALKSLPEDFTDPGANLMNSAVSGSYPIARLLYYLVHEENVAWYVLVYLNWVLVRGQTFIPSVGYVPINGTSAADYSIDVVASLSPTRQP